MTRKISSRKITRTCAICDREAKVFVYEDGTYRGGHYFGDIPLYTKKALKEMSNSGTHEVKIDGQIWNVFNKNPKPYKYAEYWECPKCYWSR